MSLVIADISMSLDGYVTGPDAGPGIGLGVDGWAIHQWVVNSHESAADRQFLEAGEQVGAIVMGRNLFDVVDSPDGWNEDINYAYDHDLPKRPPVVVVTHRPPTQWRLPDITFVTDGVGAAIDAARQLSDGRDVSVMGGAQIIDQAVVGRHVDRLCIHLSPVLMGAGTRLFALMDQQVKLVQDEVISTDNAVHLTYRISDRT